MTYFEIIMLALALSADACTVSFSYGILPLENPAKERFMLASFTGIFQAIMPLVGYFLTSFAYNYISPYAGLIVFIIFVSLGIKFIYEGFSKQEDKPLCISIGCLLLVGIATSIDAFSAGISLKLFGNGILKPALLIGTVTFINSNIGFWAGKKLSKLPLSIMGLCSGLIMIFLGVKAIL